MTPPRLLTGCRTLGPLLVLGVVAIGVAAVAHAGADAGPIPSNGLRELTTDRPDTTESPFTVDPDHLQLEMDVARFTRNRHEGVRTREWVFAPFNLRYGVTRAVELGIFVTPRIEFSETPRGGQKTTKRAAGDTTLRAKWNLRGNDGGPMAYGVIADVTLPTATNGLGNDKVQGALKFPVAYEIGGGWDGGAMTSVEFAQTERGRRPVWINTVTFGRDLAPQVGCYFELTSGTGDGTHVATFDCGLTRRFGPSLQIDAGVNIGLSGAAADLTVFAGLSRKF